ncbi:MAG: Hpt domain-containing protein, partial [Tatlockia sp.]|nr:Hpt domain-containing protein [Tatlockia sp.]
MGDYSMLDLFRQEVAIQVANLKQSLSNLKQQPLEVSELETALQSLKPIAGSAQLVELEAVANLAAAMTGLLDDGGSSTLPLTQKQIDSLLHALDLLVGISHAEDLEGWLAAHAEEFSSTQAAIADTAQQAPLRTDTRVEPASTINSSPMEAITDSPIAVAAPPLFDSSMLDLFRLEVEAQVTTLTDSLLALETNPNSAQELEALMRAAHSIKGAARIVGLDAAVGLAHVMEDCFVAAQNQTITLTGDQIDVLLRGVDLLQSFSSMSDLHDSTKKAEIGSIQATISAIQTPGAALVTKDTQSFSKPTPNFDSINSAPIAETEPISLVSSPVIETSVVLVQEADEMDVAIEPITTQDRVVRVNAENLNRMMGLAGESMIEANWLNPFIDSLMLLKSRQLELAKCLEKLQLDAISSRSLNPEDITLLEIARRKERECRDLTGDRVTQLEGFVQRTANLSDRLYREVIASHMRPFADGVQSFNRMIRDIARKLNKQVKLDIIGKLTAVDRDILKKLEAPLTHILRNAVDHGIELPEVRLASGKPAMGTIRLEAVHRGGMLAIVVADDGKGITPEMLRQQVIDKKLVTAEVAAKLTDNELMEFLFLSGFSLSKQVSELSGRGVGLDIAKSMAQEVGGTVRAASQPGLGTSFHFQLPLTLSVVRTLLVEISGETYAFPLARIDQIVNVKKSEIAAIETRQYFTIDKKNIGLIP